MDSILGDDLLSGHRGSIGLIFFEYLNATAKTAAIEEAYRSITAGEPVVRSSFDVYLTKNRLVYVKEPCAPADTKPRFFLHIIPDSANDLPDDRKQHGFDNLDFNFSQNSGRYFGGNVWRSGRSRITRSPVSGPANSYQGRAGYGWGRSR